MKRIIFLAILSTLLLGCKTGPATSAAPATEAKKEAKPVEMNPAILISNKNMGNCLSCHAVPNHPELAAGDLGPPFIGMKERFPDIAKLRAAIYDQHALTPQTLMPPFGRNKILTPEQIDVIAQYIYQY